MEKNILVKLKLYVLIFSLSSGLYAGLGQLQGVYELVDSKNQGSNTCKERVEIKRMKNGFKFVLDLDNSLFSPSIEGHYKLSFERKKDCEYTQSGDGYEVLCFEWKTSILKTQISLHQCEYDYKFLDLGCMTDLHASEKISTSSFENGEGFIYEARNSKKLQSGFKNLRCEYQRVL
ncbi:hypothetical protein N9O57_00045 [bacterium]|nr:hypothetical protein [bacterium]